MPRGIEEKIAFRIRPKYKESDLMAAEDYFGKLKKDAKKNKLKIMRRDSGDRIEAIMVEKADIEKTEEQNFIEI